LHTRHQLSLEGFSDCVILASDFDTPVSWAKHFSDFLLVSSSLTPMSFNLFSKHSALMFVFLSVKSPVVLSLVTKLWIVCPVGTLSSWNVRRNFGRHFLADPYFSWVSYRNTRWSKV
jgi:hypothetical protein